MTSLELPSRSITRVNLEFTSWIILALAGFLGNIAVIAAFARNPRLRKFTPVYIIALAISDILNLVSNGMFTAVTLPEIGNLGTLAVLLEDFPPFSSCNTLLAPCHSRPLTDTSGLPSLNCLKKSSRQKGPL